MDHFLLQTAIMCRNVTVLQVVSWTGRPYKGVGNISELFRVVEERIRIKHCIILLRAISCSPGRLTYVYFRFRVVNIVWNVLCIWIIDWNNKECWYYYYYYCVFISALFLIQIYLGFNLFSSIMKTIEVTTRYVGDFSHCSSSKNRPYDSCTSAANVVGTLIYLKQKLLTRILLYNI